MEKPFGTDFDSAVLLNQLVHQVFRESQIFRIDHFLGKKRATSILAFRFANGLFEPIWNRNFIDHIQIDIPETLGLDRRAGFYESTGAYKDMVVTHLFQVMAFVAIETPTALEPRTSWGEEQGLPSLLPIGRPTWSAASTAVQAGGRCPRTRRPRPSSPSSAASTTGAGPASRSCAPASAWPRASGSSPSPSARRHRACSGRVRGRPAGPGPSHLRPGRRDQGVIVVLRQATRSGMKMDKLSMQFSAPPIAPRTCWKPTNGSSWTRCVATTPVHRSRGHREPLGTLDSCWRTAAGQAVHPGLLGTQRDPPAHRRTPGLPFERTWRETAEFGRVGHDDDDGR